MGSFLRSAAECSTEARAGLFFAGANFAVFTSAFGFFPTTVALGTLAASVLAFDLPAGFFATPETAFGSSLSCVNSNAGFGTARSFGPTRVSKAAGFTPAAAAAFAIAGFNGDCLAVRSRSGFTIIWLS